MTSTLKPSPTKLDQPTVNGSENVFMDRPIRLDGFTLHAYGVEPSETPTPTLTEWHSAFRLATSSHESSPYWVGDLLAYADTQARWRTLIDQAKSDTGLSHQTLLNQASISRQVQGPQRRLAPSYSHAAAVARFRADEQHSLLSSARAYGWTVPQLRKAARRAKRGGPPSIETTACKHTVDVTVRLTVDASSSWEAQEQAWQAVKTAIACVPHAHVISATALNVETVEAS